MQQRLTELWYAPARPSLLQPLGWLYAAAMRMRRALYGSGLLRSVRPQIPVVIVGNLTVGGTGKTPLTLWLAAALTRTGPPRRHRLARLRPPRARCAGGDRERRLARSRG